MKELIEKAKAHFQPYIEQGKIHTIEHNFLFDVTELVYKDEETFFMVAFCPDDVLINWFYKILDGKTPVVCKSDVDIQEIPKQFQVLAEEVQQDLNKFNEKYVFLIQQLKSNSLRS